MKEFNDPKDESLQQEVRRHATTGKIIVGAMIMGVLIFAFVVLALNISDEPKEPNDKTFTYIALAFSLGGLAAAAFIPNMIVGQRVSMLASGKTIVPALKQDAPSMTVETQLLHLYQTRMLIRSALLEGAALFCLIAYLIEANPLTLGLAAVLLAGLMTQIPTVGRILLFLDEQSRRMEELRRRHPNF